MTEKDGTSTSAKFVEKMKENVNQELKNTANEMLDKGGYGFNILTAEIQNVEADQIVMTGEKIVDAKTGDEVKKEFNSAMYGSTSSSQSNSGSYGAVVDWSQNG